MGRPVIDRTGETFGRMTIVELVPKPWRSENAEWVCRCVCGTERVIDSSRFSQDKYMTCMRGECHPGWTGDNVEYTGAHWRLRQDLGPASSHKCVDCPNQARDWSYVEAKGYSLDIADYSPRCTSCHRLHDAALRR